MKLSEILIDGAPAGFSYYIDGVQVSMTIPQKQGFDTVTANGKKYRFEDQSIEIDGVDGDSALAAFWVCDKEGVGCVLRVVETRTVTVGELVAARGFPIVQVEDDNKGEPTQSLQPTPTSTQKETKSESVVRMLKQDVAQHGHIKLSTMWEVTKSCGGHVTLTDQFCNFKQWCYFNDQAVELKAHQRQCNFDFSTSVKTVTGHHREISFLSIDKDIALELDKIISSQHRSTLDKPSDQTELVQQLQKRLDELEKTVADLKKETANGQKPFKLSDLLGHIPSAAGYRFYLDDKEITVFYSTLDGSLIAETGAQTIIFQNQDLVELEYPPSRLMSYTVLETYGKYYNLRVTCEQPVIEKKFFSK